jgi:O-antigen ligase
MKKALTAVVISAAFVSLFTLFELLFPGRVLVPNWLYTHHRAVLIVKGLRMGGPFLDYELLSEFFALNIPLIFLCFVRSKKLSGRVVYALLLFADLFLMFSTITRGGVIILIMGFIYMAFISRRDLNFIRLVAFTAILVFLMASIDAFIARYTTSGSTFARLFASTFKRGVIPENRYAIWSRGISMGLETPFLGHGPAWDYIRGVTIRLIPHNIFMYLFDLTGLFGLSAFIFFLYRLVKMSVGSIGASLASSPFPQALLKMLHVCLVMFILDQMKVEYLRNNIYTYFVWLLFGLIAATHSIIQQNAREQAFPAPSP